MENLYNGWHHTGQTLDTDATLRLPKHPQKYSNSSPKAFEDFGSSLAPRANSQSKFKPATIVPPKSTRLITIKKPVANFLSSDSEDEIDFLSSSQPDPDDFQPSKKATTSKAGKYLDEKGKEHDYNPKFLPSKNKVLLEMKFKKHKEPIGENNTNIPSSSSWKNQSGFKENDQDFGSWVNDLKKQSADKQVTEDLVDDDVLEISSPLHVKSANRHPSPLRPQPKQPSHRELPNACVPPRPKPRPLSRPTGKLNANTWGSKSSANAGSGLTTWSTSQFKFNPTVVDKVPLRCAKKTTTAKKNNPSQSYASSPEISTSTPMKRQPPSSSQNFPMDVISPLGEKVQRKPLPKPGSKTGNFSAFPMPSPQSSDRIVARVASQSKGKNKAQPFPLGASNEDEGADESDYDVGGKGKAKAKGRQKSRRKPRAFPMPTQMLASIESPGVPKGRLSKHQKRMSEGCSDDEPQAKKKRQSSLSPSQYTFEDEGDSISISSDTDPRTLCPYCDTPLPSSPSPLLINILAATRKKSTRDPRPSNPLGLKAPLATFIVACQRHKFESQILPEAERKGWPKTIPWQKLGARVEMMRDELRALIEDPGGELEVNEVDEDINEIEKLFEDDDNESRRKGPKARSIFWTEAMDEVKKKGSRAVVGVRGQFANFEKTQPGYYGEQGSVIIHQTLFDMFPPASFDPARISPLTSNEFVLRILVPEVALRLIMEDRDLEGNDGMHQALMVLRESSAYGVAMFPEDGGELGTGKKRGDVMGVGDKIVMERARKRRKELEEEEEQEEREEARRIAEMEAEVEMEQVKETGRRKRKGKQIEDQQHEELQAPVERPRPRPRPIVKASNNVNVLPSSDREEALHPPRPSGYMSPRKKGTNRNRSRTRSMHSGMDSDFSTGLAIDISSSEGDDYHRPTSVERRRSPSASESKLENARKPSSTRASSRGFSVSSVGSDSDASICSRTSTKPAVRRSLRQKGNAIEKSDSTMVVDLDETPVRRHNAKIISNDEPTPKPLMLPRIGESNDIKPLMVARMRQSQKDDSGSKFGEADMSCKLRNDEWTPNIHKEDVSDEEAEVVSSPNNYKWLLNDTSQSSTEGRNWKRRY